MTKEKCVFYKKITDVGISSGQRENIGNNIVNGTFKSCGICHEVEGCIDYIKRNVINIHNDPNKIDEGGRFIGDGVRHVQSIYSGQNLIYVNDNFIFLRDNFNLKIELEKIRAFLLSKLTFISKDEWSSVMKEIDYIKEVFYSDYGISDKEFIRGYEGFFLIKEIESLLINESIDLQGVASIFHKEFEHEKDRKNILGLLYSTLLFHSNGQKKEES